MVCARCHSLRNYGQVGCPLWACTACVLLWTQHFSAPHCIISFHLISSRQVKDETTEALLPDFDFARVIGERLRKAYGRRAVVLVVVDAADFDGSFPRRAAQVGGEREREQKGGWHSAPGIVTHWKQQLKLTAIKKIGLMCIALGLPGWEPWSRTALTIE